MKKSLYALLMLGIITGTGCKKLDEEAYTFYTPSNYYNNADELNVALNSVYKLFQKYYGGGDIPGYFLKIITSSEFGAPSYTKDNAANYNVWAYPNNPDYSIYRWGPSYEIINQANVVLGRGKDVQMEDALKTRMFAEARYLRGLTYFHILRLYGGAAIPEGYTEGLKDLNIPRKSVDETYDYIIADLKYAAENLPKKSQYAASDVWRASQGAAQALLGKVFLYRGSMEGKTEYFQESKKYSGMVIASNEYALESNFKDLWSWWNPNNKNGKESVFEIQFGYLNKNNNMFHIHGGMNISDPALGSYMYHRYGPSLPAYNSFSDQDARKEATFLTKVTLSTGKTIEWDPADKGSWPGSKGWTTSYPGMIKYYDRSAESRTSGPGNDFYFMRYAEVLLNYAEAENEVNGPTADAYAKINMVRNRAQLPDLTTGLSKQQFSDALYRERGWEFIGEGQLYYDGLRTGRLGQAVKDEVAYGVSHGLYLYTPLQFAPKKTFLWKIPTYDIGASPAIEQNPDNVSE